MKKKTTKPGSTQPKKGMRLLVYLAIICLLAMVVTAILSLRSNHFWLGHNDLQFSHESVERPNTDSKCPDIKRKEVVVYVAHVSWLKYEQEIWKPRVCACDVQCRWTTDPQEQHTADVILKVEKREKPHPGVLQKTAWFNIEGYWKDDPGWDIVMSHTPEATIQVTYADTPPELYFTPEAQLNMSNKRKDNFTVAFFSSRCVEERQNFVGNLSKHIYIHGLGKCHNNSNVDQLFPECAKYVSKRRHDANWYLQKACVANKFKFLLAIENTITPGYVTEKLLYAWHSGVVPVYKGAPDVDRYAPGVNSYIDASKFETYEDLANYLKMLNENDEEYAKFFEWKKRPLKESFNWVYQHSFRNMGCLLCEHVARESRVDLAAID